jgi:hypothetical protein
MGMFSPVTRHDTGIIFVEEQQAVADGRTLDRNIRVFSCDSENDAKLMASHMAEKHPGVSYLVCPAVKLYCCSPGKVVIKEFSDKGLVPL